MKLSNCSALLISVPYPILKGSSWAALDFIPVPCQGYDPDAKAAFQPKAKQKGRSSTASMVKRKKKVMDQEHRVRKRGCGQVSACPSSASPAHFARCSPLPCRQDKVRQSLEQQQQKQKTAKPTGARPSALDRFVL